jgi:hypothetical protein
MRAASFKSLYQKRPGPADTPRSDLYVTGASDTALRLRRPVLVRMGFIDSCPLGCRRYTVPTAVSGQSPAPRFLKILRAPEAFHDGLVWHNAMVVHNYNCAADRFKVLRLSPTGFQRGCRAGPLSVGPVPAMRGAPLSLPQHPPKHHDDERCCRISA